MSADNYNLVKRLGDTWRVWLNLSASCTRDQALAETKPARDFTDVGEAIEWADAQGFTEYGTEVDDGTADEAHTDGKCICYARMAGECMCGAWDEPIAPSGPDPRDARIRELEAALAEACDEWMARLDDGVARPAMDSNHARVCIAALRELARAK